ncbi:MAG TPA: aryl-sulfate sulfotransferase [Ignavibacteriales bacterium]|nr:aryl-sulfate sulfotransferase [Ignavibacteriales bacterium]
MKSYLLCLLFIFFYNAAEAQNAFTYISPKPNSALVSGKTNIILRSAEAVDPSSLASNLISIKGDQSGVHSGQLILSDDKRTIIFSPSSGYLPNETVSVHLSDGIKTAEGRKAGTLEFSFKISPLTEDANSAEDSFSGDEFQNNKTGSVNSFSPLSTDPLPTDLPVITVGTSNNPAEGKIFLANQSQTTSKTIGSYLLIYNNDGSIARYFKIPQSGSLFKVEPNGQLSYNLKGNNNRIIMDTSFVPVDTLKCGNGYKTNGHDALLLPNGHAILIANDKQPVDMSLVIQGGDPNAQVTGLVVQELDASHNVVFQWRSWDYIPITASYFDLTMADIDLLHTNALSVDKDSNILVSMRHLSSIVKINRETGNVDWILGGKLNQFTFINEHEANGPTYFSYQHDIEVLPNSNITLFDDGTQHSPQYSRGVEYKLDEQHKTATMVWEYRHSPDIYADAMGSVQRLPNGNTVIGWGNKTGAGIPVYTEVHPDNSIALELFFPVGQFCYRAYKYPWISQTPDASVTINEILEGNTYSYSNSSASTGIKIKFKQLDVSSIYCTSICSKYNYSPQKPVFIDNAPLMAPYYFSFTGLEINSFTGEVHVDLSKFPGISVPRKTQVYVKQLYSEVFVPLATSYDSLKNELVFNANVFGEYAFGIPQNVSTLAPVPFSPKDNEIVNGEASVTLSWGTKGIVQTYNLQVSTDSTFSNPKVDIKDLTATSYTLSSLANNAKYFWRVNNSNSAGISEWSTVNKFFSASPYIKVMYPGANKNLYVDSIYVIRWQSNVNDKFNIHLLSGNGSVTVIADSVTSNTKAFLWEVPSSIKLDSLYRIRITSLDHANLTDTSDHTFSIGKATSGVSDLKVSSTSYQLCQNYPNPFNPITTITYSIPKESNVELKVYNMLGSEVTTLVSKKQNAGVYSLHFDGSNLPSGIYIYTIHAGQYRASKKLVLLK